MSKIALSIWKEVLTILSGNFSQFLVMHLIYLILGTIIFTPLAGIIGQGLLNISGQSVFSDFDILYFVLTPLGMLSAIGFASLLITIIILEQASMMLISGSSIQRTAGRRHKAIDLYPCQDKIDFHLCTPICCPPADYRFTLSCSLRCDWLVSAY